MNEKPPKRPRLADVAQLAGVSLGSASRAMTVPDAVKPKTLAAVKAAAQALGYIPNENGRALASRRSQSVGIVLPTINNPVYAAFVHHLQKGLSAHNYSLFVLAHEYDRAVEAAYIERLVRRGADGIVLIGGDQAEGTHALLERAGVPRLVAWSVEEPPGKQAIGFSNRAAMESIVAHLAKLGHRHVAMLSGAPERNERAAARIAAVREAAARHRLRLTRIIIVPLQIEGGRFGFDQWHGAPEGETALICATDTIAAGALAAARQAGVDVPGALSITGFDDVEMAAILSPALTTVRTPVAAMAAGAAAAILAMIAGDPLSPTPVLDTSLVVRHSTAPAYA